MITSSLSYEPFYWSVSPYINQFLSADTIVPGYANPQNLNRYSYVSNNPLRYTDPTGHMRVDDEFGGGNVYTPPISSNNNGDNHDDESSEEYEVLPSPQPDGPIPPDWLSNIRWIWRSGPDWLFRVEDGRRILMVNHPHQGVSFWHINSDLRFLPHAVNIEPALRIVTAAQPIVTAYTAFAGAAESFIPVIVPRPDMFMPLLGQPEIYN